MLSATSWANTRVASVTLDELEEMEHQFGEFHVYEVEVLPPTVCGITILVDYVLGDGRRRRPPRPISRPWRTSMADHKPARASKRHAPPRLGAVPEGLVGPPGRPSRHP